MRRGQIATAALVAMLTAATPAVGQPGQPSFWSAGLELIGQSLAAGPEDRIRLRVQTRGEQCGIGQDLIASEAERALRRDGIGVGRELVLGPVLLISVLALPVARGGQVLGCALSVVVELDWRGLAQRVRAFQTVEVLVVPLGEQAGIVRVAVEESVSVLANRLRRELDTAREAR